MECGGGETVNDPALRFRKDIQGTGYHELVSLACAPLEHITFGLHRFGAGEVARFGAPDREMVLVILNGKLSAAGDRIGTAALERQSVFADPAVAAYIAAGDEISLHAQCQSEVAVAKAPSASRTGAPTQIIAPAQLRRRIVLQAGCRLQVGQLQIRHHHEDGGSERQGHHGAGQKFQFVFHEYS